MLALTVDHHPGQSLTSFASGLARRNFRPNARIFAREMGINFRDIVEGADAAVEGLANLTGVEPTRLSSSALRRVAGRNFTIGKEYLVASTLRRHAVVVCPCCLIADLATGRFGNELDMFHRVAWEITHVRTCLVHGIALVNIDVGLTNNNTFDFAFHVADRRNQIVSLSDKPEYRKPSTFEEYLIMRIAGTSLNLGWLDTIPFFLAARACEVIGAVAMFGRTPNFRLLTEADWARSGAAGFDILRDGPMALRNFLSTLQLDNDDGGSGPKKWFGRIYEWLAFSHRDHQLEPIREIVREHIRDTASIPDGSNVLGKVVLGRKVHSVFSASREYGIHPKTVRKILTAAGLVPHDNAQIADNRLTFAVESGGTLLADISEGIPANHIGAYLSMTRTQVAKLKRRYFRPILEASGIEPLYRKRDLDDFIARLLTNAVPVPAPGAGEVSIAEAVIRSNRQTVEVVDLILQRQLDWVGQATDRAGFESVLVDLDEVKSRVRLAPVDGLSLREFADTFGVRDSSVALLIENGLVETKTVVNPVNRCPQSIITKEKFEALSRNYVSLRDLARDRSVHSKTLLCELRARRILPLPDWQNAGAFVFIRRDVE